MPQPCRGWVVVEMSDMAALAPQKFFPKKSRAVMMGKGCYMAKLTTAKRNALPDSDFAGPNRTYPINDRTHAIKAEQLGRPGPQLRAKIDAKVARKFAGLGSAVRSGVK